MGGTFGTPMQRATSEYISTVTCCRQSASVHALLSFTATRRDCNSAAQTCNIYTAAAYITQ